MKILYLLIQLFVCVVVAAQGDYPVTYEAENGILLGVAGINTNHANYSGNGFVDNFIAENATLIFNNLYANKAGDYYFMIRYAAGLGNRNMSVSINNTSLGQINFENTDDWSTWQNKVLFVSLNEGFNTVTIAYENGDEGYINIDYVWFSKNENNGIINHPIEKNGTALVVEKYVQIPKQGEAEPRLNTFAFTGNQNFVGEEKDGRIYEIFEDANGNTSINLFLDVKAAISTATNRGLNNSSTSHGGLRGLAFHPEFNSNGKLYTSLMEDRPEDPSQFNYISDDPDPVDADGCLIEWTYNFANNTVDPNSYRLLFRIGMPVYDHTIKQIAFNRYANAGDEDYGLLYISLGDGSVQSATTGGGQNNDGLGKILRIDPLENASEPYTIPSTNPFVGNPNMKDEVYAYGFRNPHTLSFNKNMDGQVYLIAGEAGRDNIEEINLILPGANYGWANRDGTFVHLPQGGIVTGVAPLSAGEAQNGCTYPVAMWAHTGNIGQGFVGQALAGGYVFQNAAAGINQYMLADFPKSGRIFYCDFDDMVNNTFQLNPNDPTKDEPYELTQSILKEYDILFDDDKNVNTPPIAKTSMFDLINDEPNHSGERSDLRFGRDASERIYIMSKRNGWIYRITDIHIPHNACNVSKLYQAENLYTNTDIDSIYNGHTGSGYVNYITNVGDYVSLYTSVDVDASCNYQMDIRYSSGLATRTMNIYANGVYIETATFPATGNWSTWEIYTTQIPLTQGNYNTVTLKYDNGNTGFINVDYLKLGCEPILGSCDCTAGTFQDADNDGVCDLSDLCAGYDDSWDDDFDGLPNKCDNCPLNHYLTQSYNNQLNQYAQNEIHSQQIISSTTNIKYKAGNLVRLKSGFKVEIGARFSAGNETCY